MIYNYFDNRCGQRKTPRSDWPRWLRGWLGVLLVCAAATASAAEISALYATWVPLDDQQEATRNAALKAALAQVFVKVSGKRAVLPPAELPKALANTPAMVQQYSYQSRLLTPGGDPRLGLWVEFDSSRVNSALREANVQTWGNIRPTVLIWMALRDEAGSLGAESHSAGLAQTDALSIVRRVENHRGVSLLLTQQTSSDQSGIDMANLEDVADDTIRNVSARRGAQAVLIARTQRTAGGFWEARWTLYIGHVQQSWTTVEDRIELAIEEGLQRCVDRLATLYLDPSPTQEATQFNVVVNGIAGFSDFTRALKALRQSDRTQSVQPRRFYRDKAVFRVSVSGSANVFLNVISMGGVLSAQPASVARPGANTALQLLLSPR